ncbi:dihydroorotase-like cyclic amidohydrolase [Sphaerochaeta pleomorpha str. Grapes]|uniref:Dihydroorotase-like cyclic amidohydrolase n=1 Tax=Sphaerochaeta pleomorpha (strain ATCC BAA-1885 / DSM 22778 / Grapes) TaxID=158190 RepID=G8QXR0_SPHPG|nr:dihydroorotase [Sphaerochaeta pleomorpha]AEV30704.1 dihydroorotase-like cyclic amidohydrolase [Sphaerochaeta pleomorpha str. Grapes]
MIDAHVHLRDWGQREKETLAHGFAVAKLCGVEEFFDMPNTVPPLTSEQEILRRLEDAKAAGLKNSYHLYAGLTGDSQQIASMVELTKKLKGQVIGLKLFAGHSTGNMGLVTEQQQRKVYEELAASQYEGVVAVHCEKESLLLPDLEDPTDFSTHSLARPSKAEVQSVADQLEFCRDAGFKGTLHICHLSSPEALDLIEEAKRRGQKVTCAVTPHHVLLSSEVAKDQSLYAKMNPPLRSEAERKQLFSALLSGRIDWIETDHAPHTLQDKRNGACGIPGFSGLLLLVKVLLDNDCSPTLLKLLVGGRVSQVFGLGKKDIFIPAYENLLELSSQAAKMYVFDPFLTVRQKC